MRSRTQFAILSIMQLLVTASFIAAQTSSSSLQGTVTDPSGSAIGGASVMLSSNESKLEQANVPVNPRLGERPFTEKAP